VPGWDDASSMTGKFKMIFSMAYILFGLACISMSFNLMMEEMIAKFSWLGRKLGIIDGPIKEQEMTGAKWKRMDDDSYFMVNEGAKKQGGAFESGDTQFGGLKSHIPSH